MSPGIVMKRMRRSQYGDSNNVSRADENLARVMLEIRILTSDALHGLSVAVKLMGVCFEESIASLDPLGAGQFHLLLEYSELGDMASFLTRNGQQLDMEVKLDLASQVSVGLLILHHELICHGDLKIQNVLVFNGNNGHYRAKLADFGLSVHSYDWTLGEDSKKDVYYPPGTPLLNAPEVRNRNVSTKSIDIAAAIRAEVFSFGLLLWEILKDGQSYFNMAWSDTARASNLEMGTEEQMAFLSTLPPNELLLRGEEFLVGQVLDEQHQEQILRVFHASLQDDPLQRQPMHKIWKILLPPTKKDRIDFDRLEATFRMTTQLCRGFKNWSTSFPKTEFLNYTCLNLPHSLQRRALDELKMYATSSSSFELRERAALDLAECHLISFGTGYDLAEALRWLKVAKEIAKSRFIPSLCLHRMSEALESPPLEVSKRPESQLETTPQGIGSECRAISEQFLMRKIQSRIASAVTQIRALSPEGHSWLHVNYIEMKATPIAEGKIGLGIVGSVDMTTLDVAALLGEDEILSRRLPNAEAFRGHENQLNPLHYSCIGGNMSTLEFLLDYGIDSSLCARKNITALHLLIYMPADLVDRAVNLLIAHGAPTDICSQATRLLKIGLDLVGTPVEWAVIARNRGLVAALLPHSKGQEKSILRHAISHAYYEIAEDMLSNGDFSDLFTEEDCPTLVFDRAFAHLICHGRYSDLAVERTIRLCDAHNLIHYEKMLGSCIPCAKTRSCFKALEVLFDLCPTSIVRQGFGSDELDVKLVSILYTTFAFAKSNKAWRPVLEVILRNFSVAELEEVRELKESGSARVVYKANVLHTAVFQGWAIAVRVLLEKGVNIHQRMPLGILISNFDLAVLAWDDEIQAILSEYGGGNESSLDNSMAKGDPSRWFVLQESMRRRGFTGFSSNSLGDKDASTLFAVSKAHEILLQLLISRDAHKVGNPTHAQDTTFEILLWKEFRALISNESIAGHIDTPDEDGVTMLQRATAYLDIDVIRLILEAGADANVPFLATKRVDGDENDLIIPFLPFQIACWVSRTKGSLLKSGTIETKEQYDAVATNQIILQPTSKPHLPRSVTHIISHITRTGAKRIKELKSGPALSSGARIAESLMARSLNVAQEFLRWHLLRNDRRFEGITEYHLCTYTWYVSRGLMLLHHDRKVGDAKASWPGIEGKYTAVELGSIPRKDETRAFLSNFLRLSGVKMARKRIEKSHGAQE